MLRWRCPIAALKDVVLVAIINNLNVGIWHGSYFMMYVHVVHICTCNVCFIHALHSPLHILCMLLICLYVSVCVCVCGCYFVSSRRVSRQCRRIMCPLLSLAVAVAAVVVVLVGVVVVAPFLLLLLLLLAAAVVLLRKRIGFRCTCARQKSELRYSCSKA